MSRPAPSRSLPSAPWTGPSLNAVTSGATISVHVPSFAQRGSSAHSWHAQLSGPSQIPSPSQLMHAPDRTASCEQVPAITSQRSVVHRSLSLHPSSLTQDDPHPAIVSYV